MKTARLALGVFVFVAVLGSVAMAQAQRTFVSGLGNDGNPCSRTAPCRTLQAAINAVSEQGEVAVLDSAGYGQITITKPITIEAPPGTYAGISATGIGISVSVAAGQRVVLRGLTVYDVGIDGPGVLAGFGPDVSGSALASSWLVIERCKFTGFAGDAAIQIQGGGNFLIKESTCSRSVAGVDVRPPSGQTATVILDNVTLDSNEGALLVRDGAVATIRNSIITGNTGPWRWRLINRCHSDSGELSNRQERHWRQCGQRSIQFRCSHGQNI